LQVAQEQSEQAHTAQLSVQLLQVQTTHSS